MSTDKKEEYWEPPQEEALFNGTELRLAFEKFIYEEKKSIHSPAGEFFQFLLKQVKSKPLKPSEPPIVAPSWVDEWNRSGSGKYPL
jgi:hypothetical protein